MTLAIEVSMRDARSFVETTLNANLVPYLEGSPGIGKSALARAFARDYNLKMIDYRASTGAPEDLNGIPFREGDQARFIPFTDNFPVVGMEVPEGKNGWLLFLDELSNAPRHMQAALYKLILDRQVGVTDLHPNVFLMSAGNSVADRAAANPMGNAMKSRLIHFKLHVVFEEWMEDIAIPQNYSPQIIAFLSANKHKLMDFNPDTDDVSFPCPRTWEAANRLIGAMGDGTGKVSNPVTQKNLPLFAGAVGSGAATEFISFSEVFSRLPSIKEILTSPNLAPVPHESAILWAVSSILQREATMSNVAAILQYTSRLPASYLVLVGRSIRIRLPQVDTLPEWNSFKQVLVKVMTV